MWQKTGNSGRVTLRAERRIGIDGVAEEAVSRAMVFVRLFVQAWMPSYLERTPIGVVRSLRLEARWNPTLQSWLDLSTISVISGVVACRQRTGSDRIRVGTHRSEPQSGVRQDRHRSQTACCPCRLPGWSTFYIRSQGSEHCPTDCVRTKGRQRWHRGDLRAAQRQLD